MSGNDAGGPAPTFASQLSGHPCECQNQRTTGKNSSAGGAFDLTFA